MMNHIFITRIAVLLGGKAKITHTKQKIYSTISDRLNDVVKYWQRHASRFYELQSKDDPFKVYLVYSPCYEHIVRSFEFPNWCVLTKDRKIDRIRSPEIYNAYDGQKLSVSRIDADDWYSNDYFEYLNCSANEPGVKTHLHKNIRLYDRSSKKISVPQPFSSPGFASIVFNEFDKSLIPLNTTLWPHGDIKRRPHVTPEHTYCMQSVGCNVVNKWRKNSKEETNHESLSRFYIPT